MKRLILVRHATAVDKGPEGSDFHRRLKKRGKREARVMADQVKALIEVPDQMLSSPADRALETAGIFAEHFGVPAERVTLREELYGGLDPGEFLHIIQRLDDTASSVMIFGHDPSFTEFAGYMIPAFTDSIPKAGVLVMDIDRPRWKAVRQGEAKLVHFERPPAPDEQKRMDNEVLDRLVVAIQQGILASTRPLEIADSEEAARLIARTSTKLARDLRPFVRAKSTKREKDKPAAKKKNGKTRARSAR